MYLILVHLMGLPNILADCLGSFSPGSKLGKGSFWWLSPLQKDWDISVSFPLSSAAISLGVNSLCVCLESLPDVVHDSWGSLESQNSSVCAFSQASSSCGTREFNMLVTHAVCGRQSYLPTIKPFRWPFCKCEITKNAESLAVSFQQVFSEIAALSKTVQIQLTWSYLWDCSSQGVRAYKCLY